MKKLICCSLLILLCVSCKKENTLHVMSYNLQNLFDTKHDEGKNDVEFLPKNHFQKQDLCKKYNSEEWYNKCLETDWTDEKLKLKIHQIKKVITNIDSELPDVLAVQEVENKSVLRQLAGELGYKLENVLLEEGLDKRGIDVGLIYKEDKLKYIQHKVFRYQGEDFEEHPTRDLLAVYFQHNEDFTKSNKGVKDVILAFYIVHYPSQAATSKVRAEVSSQINSYIQSDYEEFGERLHAVILGDFNVTFKEEGLENPAPIKDALLTSSFYDTYFLNDELINKNLPEGSYFYSHESIWSLFDRVIISRNLYDRKNLDIVKNSFTIHNFPLISKLQKCYKGWICDTDFYTPNKYDFSSLEEERLGFSDHYPISVRIKNLTLDKRVTR